MEERVRILITDTHFGVRNNSSKFLSNQLRFFDELIEYIETCEHKKIDLIHLGDMFDNRSTVSINVLDNVGRVFKEVYQTLIQKDDSNRIIFVAGNHDFYAQNNDAVNSIDVLLKPIFKDCRCKFVTRMEYFDEGILYLPWYITEDPDLLREVYSNYIDETKVIMCHTDLNRVKSDLSYLQKVGVDVISGHIHTSAYYEFKYQTGAEDKTTRCFNISPPYAMTFNDAADDKKGFWLLKNDELSLVRNNKSLMFWTIRDEGIFDIDEDNIDRGDNYNIYINSKNMVRENYIDRLRYLSTRIQYINIIPVNENNWDEGQVDELVDIDTIIYKLLGSEKTKYFDKIKELAKECE